MSNNQFRANIKRRIEEAKRKQDLFYRKLAIEILTRVVLKSPVDTGRFRANWQVGYGAINYTTINGFDKSGAMAVNGGTSIINSLKIDGQMIYVTNSLPYAYRLEYEGWSRQAPGGMVRVTLAEFGDLVHEVASEVRKNDIN